MKSPSERTGAPVIWLTGLPASGKTTLAKALTAEFQARARPYVWLDSDALREVLTPDASYERGDRDHFYQVIGHLAELATQGGCIALVSATASKRRYRDNVRHRVSHFIEVWLRCSRDTLRKRDFKGLYQKAAEGDLPNLPGSGEAYEAPERPELELDTEAEDTSALVAKVMALVG